MLQRLRAERLARPESSLSRVVEEPPAGKRRRGDETFRFPNGSKLRGTSMKESLKVDLGVEATMRALLAVVGATLLVVPGIPAEPDNHIQLVGEGGMAITSYCYPVDITILVERVADRWMGKLEFVGPEAQWCFDSVFFAVFPLTGPFYHSQTIFELHGDWNAGFVGRPPLDLDSTIWIGPYGEGSSVTTEGFFMCFVSATCGWWWGTLRDVTLDNAVLG